MEIKRRKKHVHKHIVPVLFFLAGILVLSIFIFNRVNNSGGLGGSSAIIKGSSPAKPSSNLDDVGQTALENLYEY